MCRVGPRPCLQRGIGHTFGLPDIKRVPVATSLPTIESLITLRPSIAILVLLLALSVGGSNAAAQSESRWPTVFEQSFLDSCKKSGFPVATCRCELRWLEKRYTYGQLTNMYQRDKPRFRRILTRAVLACTH